MTEFESDILRARDIVGSLLGSLEDIGTPIGKDLYMALEALYRAALHAQQMRTS